MKNSILIITAICLSLSGMAQSQQWKIAFRFDPNISWMKPDDKNIEQGSNKLKFGFGIMLDKMFTDNYAFGTGFNVIHTGGELSYLYTGGYKKEGASSNTEIVAQRVRTYNLQYLEIPLTLKLRTNEIGYITYWAQMGLGLGFNIKAKADDETTYVREKVVVADNPDTPDIDEASTTSAFLEPV
jgi:Outer membrane protein beta-barrel domain